ncbi:LacI family transcriptional regulator [Nocardioides sp. BGMRC 2183]|nr:LacI family transcriptional regulator [Nocardioides sp. BGMRC 2183]
MREVASLAGVSLKTVSRVVNDEAPVTPAVRERVQRAIEQLDYRHNLAASNLRRRTGRARVLGVLLQDVGNSFSSGVLRALEDACRPHQIALLAASLDEEPDRERVLVNDLVSRRVDGLVIMPATERQDYLAADLRAGLPAVFVDRHPHGIDVDSVTVDNSQGGYDAARHVLAAGHRRIAVLSDLVTIETARLRIEGVKSAVGEFGPDAEVSFHEDLRESDAAERVVGQLMSGDQPPTAVITLRNILSAGALRALREAGAVDSVALVGYDDFPLADLVGLTVIRQNVATIGAEVARLMLSRLEGATDAPRHVVVQHELVERGSGEIRPAD